MRFPIFLLCMIFSQLNAQDVLFTVEVSTDNIQLSEVFELTFTIENGNGEFVAPAFEHFDIVGGPNISSSMQINNGHIQKKASYTYYLTAINYGEFTIEPAFYETNDNTLSSSEILITVGESKNPKPKKKKSNKQKHKRKKIIFDNQDIKKI